MGQKIKKYIEALKTISDGRYHYWDGRPMGIGCSDFTKTALQMAGIIKPGDTFHAASRNPGILANKNIFDQIPWSIAKAALNEGDILWSDGHHVATWDGKNGVYEAAPIGHGLCDNGKTSVGHYPTHTIRNCGTGTYEWSWIYRIIDDDNETETTEDKNSASHICQTAYDTVMGKYGKVYYRRDNNPTQYSWEYNVGKYHNGIWSFDCLGFVHTMVNGFCGDTAKLGGGAVMDNFVLASDEATTLNSYCSVRGSFPKTDIKPGSLLKQRDHVGLYIGERYVPEIGQTINTAEVTMSMGGGGKLSWVDVNTGKRYTCKGGNWLSTWTNWGQFDRVKYDTTKAPQATTPTAQTEPVKVNPTTSKGLDLTYRQGNIDWNKVKNAGISYIIPREGWGTDCQGKGADPKFFQNVKEAQEAGIKVPAVYHFIYGINEREAQLNAACCINNIRKAGLPQSTIIWCDLEYDTVDNARDYRGVTLTYEMQRKMAEAFCNYCKEQGYPTGIYLNRDYIQRVYGADILKRWDIWLADLEGGPDFPCVYQQYNWQGVIPGIPAKVDVNEYIGEYPTGSAKYNGQPQKDTEPTQPVTPQPTQPTTDKATARKSIATSMKVVSKGKLGETVKVLQKILTATGNYFGTIDGSAGALTVTAIQTYQIAHGLVSDGYFGPLSWTNVMEKHPDIFAKAMTVIQNGSNGEIVKVLQTELKRQGYYTGTIDGSSGPITVTAIKNYQSKNGLAVDGSFGPLSWTSLIK